VFGFYLQSSNAPDGLEMTRKTVAESRNITTMRWRKKTLLLYVDLLCLIRDTDLEITFPMVLNEGGAKSVLWRKIITDTFDVPTGLVKRRTGAPFGDAILAGVASGILKDFSVAKKWAEYIDPMEPDKANRETYMKYFELYRSIYNHVKGDFRDLAELRGKRRD